MKLSLFLLTLLVCTNLCASPWLDAGDIAWALSMRESRPLWYQTELIDGPGEQRFYARVYVREGAGLLSGIDEKGLNLVAAQFRSTDSADYLHEAIHRVAMSGRVWKKQVEDIVLATKKVEKLCDILLPAELQDKVADVAPCKHESEELCERYSATIIARIKALATTAPTIHKLPILVPHYD